MKRTQKLFMLTSTLALLANLSPAQDTIKTNKKQTVAPAAASNPVTGSGTPGQITKWIGVPGSSIIGDSNITEDKFGKVGVGTKTPTSLLTVQGMIETTLGGIKFPDGSVQTTSTANALFLVAHDSTLQGNGTVASPLGVAVPLNLSGSLLVAVLSATNSGSGDAMHLSSTGGSGLQADGLNGLVGFGTSGTGVIGSSSGGDGVRGFSTIGDGVHGEGTTGVNGIGNNISAGSGNGGIGVSAQGGISIGNGGGFGVSAKGGASTSGPGGDAFFGIGGATATDKGGDGLNVQGGKSNSSSNFGGDGIFALRGSGVSGARNGLAGRFLGDVEVEGTLTKTMGTFKIDHPLDPENKYLYHSFVESPDMMNIYNGNITTDPDGEAVVEMPEYFEALNKDFRYQLTVIGTFAQAIIASKMKGNRFVIKTNAPNVEVSWMVTGVRQDAYAEKNRVQVEVDKPAKERGYYIHPEVFNQPEEKSIDWVRRPELMQMFKQERLEAEKKIKSQQQR